ncbi:Amino acid transporter transmembrane domain-containing protein [Plasmodiophora brassicae]
MMMSKAPAHGNDDVYGRPGGNASIPSASFNFMNSVIGAGIIGLPYALKRTGSISGVALLLFIAALTDFSVALLVSAGVRSNRFTFEGLVRHLFGDAARRVVLIFMFVFSFGAMTAYVVVIGDTVPSVIHAATGMVVDRRLTIVVVAVAFLLPLVLLRSIEHLSPTSLLSMVAVLGIVGTIAFHRLPFSADDVDAFAVIKPRSMFGGIGAMSFAFVCQNNTFILYRSLQDPTPARFRIVTHVSLGASALICLAMAVTGFFRFLGQTKSNILNNFDDDDVTIGVARALLAVNMVLTYPLEMYVARQCTMQALGVPDAQHTFGKYAPVVVGLWLATTGVAVVAGDDLGTVMELTGAFAASCLGYIIPGMCHLKAVRDNGKTGRITWSAREIGAVALIVFGTVAMIAGSTSALHQDTTH